jgi:hypothetical protein
MVKAHGGESQQFHYTGLNNPLAQPSLSAPNNLGADALTFYEQLAASGHAPDDFLFYLAGGRYQRKRRCEPPWRRGALYLRRAFHPTCVLMPQAGISNAFSLESRTPC